MSKEFDRLIPVLERHLCPGFLKSVPKNLEGQLVEAYNFALGEENLFQIDGRHDATHDYRQRFLRDIGSVSLRAGHTDEFTEFIFGNIKENFSRVNMMYYNHEERSVGIIRKLYKQRKLWIYNYGDYPGDDHNMPGNYFERPGIRISRDLFNLFYEHASYINFINERFGGSEGNFITLAIAVSWNPVFFRESLGECCEYPPKECNSFYIYMLGRLIEHKDAHPDTIFTFFSHVRFDKILSIDRNSRSRDSSREFSDRLVPIVQYGLHQCTSYYRFLIMSIYFYKKDPKRFQGPELQEISKKTGACMFLQLCSELPVQIREIIVQMCVFKLFGNVKIVNGSALN